MIGKRNINTFDLSLSMRLFIALDLEELKDYFNEIQKQIPTDIAKIKPVNAFHLTLKFLGEVDKEKSEKIKQALSTIKFKPLKLKLTKELGFFPDKNYIKVIWIGLEENKELLDLQKQVEQSVHKYHMRGDFKFIPHLTLARVKFINDKEEFLDKIKKIKLKQKTITLESFKLIKSELTETGSVYEDLKIFKLG